MAEYDAIAEAYRDSKELPFRGLIERYTLFDTLGGIRGSRVLDMACGEGFYTRILKQAGAAEVTGVDLSAEMIRLAERAEQQSPLGCRYVCQDVAEYNPTEPVDIVVAMFLLNYAKTAEQLRQFCQVCHDALRPGGRFVGVNDNILNPPQRDGMWTQYGFERACPRCPKEGDAILYTVTNEDGQRFQFENFYLEPRTYRSAFRAAGFQEFRWVDLSIHPDERDNPYWDGFIKNPPILAFSATK